MTAPSIGIVFGLVSTLVSTLVAPGCAPRERIEDPSDWRGGYALLHQLLSDDVHADKILWIRSESDEIERLIDEIVALCADGLEELGALARQRSGWTLGSVVLPEIEIAARAEIESETASELLDASGPEFEIGLMLTQLRALRYASALCRALAARELDPDVLDFLESFERRSSSLRARVFAFLASRIRPPVA